MNNLPSKSTSRTKTDWRYLGLEAGLILALTYLLIFASPHNVGLIYPVPVAITAGLLTVLVIGWLVLGQRGPARLGLGVWVFLAALIVATVFSSDVRRSVPEVWLIGCMLFWMLLSAELTSRGVPAELIHKALLIVLGILSLLALLEIARWYQAWLVINPGQWMPSIQYRVTAPNLVAVLVNLSLMLLIPRIVASRSWLQRALLGVWTLLLIILLYFTSSRGGWIGAAAGFAGLALALLYHNPAPWFARLRALVKKRWPIALAAVGVVGLIAVAAWVFIRQEALPTHAPFLQSRADFWIPAWNLFIGHPLTGNGPHTFVTAFLQRVSVPPNTIFNYAHNIYLDLLSGSGLLGLGGFIFLAVIVVKTLLRHLRLAQGSDLPAVIGAAGALAAFLVHGLFDSVHHTSPTAGWAFAILLGAALGGPVMKSKVGRLSLAGFVLLPIFAWINLWWLLPYQAGVDAAVRGDWQQAAGYFDQAVERDPSLALAHQQRGLTYAFLADQGQAGALEEAIASFEQAARLDPTYAMNQANLGALKLAQGDSTGAQAVLLEATRRAPRCALCWLNLGLARLANGDGTGTITAYQKALEFYPSGATAPAWATAQLMYAVQQEWQKAHPAAATPTLDKLEAALRANPHIAASYVALGYVYLGQGRAEEAVRMAEDAQLAFDPGPDALWLKAIAMRALGDPDAASFAKQAIDLIYLNSPSGPGNLGEVQYYTNQFRRAVMPVQLVPQIQPLPVSAVWAEREVEAAEWVDGTITP